MKKEEYEWIFWSTIAIIFVLLEHNGTEPLFLYAFSLIPVLILIFIYKRSFWVIALYILIIGGIGRYTRYYRESYASDSLLAVKDFIGYVIAGKGLYNNNVMTSTGVTPFNYLPFTIFWYLPARLLHIDLRFFEMLISALVPVVFFFIGLVTNRWRSLPILAVISLTPFLLDLSSDGSNDNSAIFLLLSSVLFLFYSLKNKSGTAAVLSAFILGLSLSFKQYAFFYFIFLISFLLQSKHILPIPSKKYMLIALGVFSVVSLPFIFAAPFGFYKSIVFVEGANTHGVWGWNIWGALQQNFNVILPIRTISNIRSILTFTTILSFFLFYRPFTLSRVFTASSVSLLVYLVLNNWTSYAYFTFLIPLFCLVPLSLSVDSKKEQ